ncbi:MAG: fructose-specific PTS transporter subunit EIIC [Pseudoflavonifractor sp.]
MRITDLLSPAGVLLGAAPVGQAEALDLLVRLHEDQGNLADAARYQADVLAREAQGSTAIGMGIAVPHAKSAAVLRPGLAAMTAPAGVDCGAPDGKPSTLFFLIAAPLEGADVHLELLARLMKLLMHKDFPAQLRAAQSPAEFLALIDRAESASFPDEPRKPLPQAYQVLAVTACPTGIAHTYMAAEALEQAAAALGISIKVETQGSVGQENALSQAEIAACDGVIIAADSGVDLARFQGKPLLQVPVSDGVNRPQVLLRQITGGNAPVYRHSVPADMLGADDHLGHKIYSQLMTGVSHMLPFVIGGGVLIALAYLLDDPGLGLATFGANTPLAAWCKTMGTTAFRFMMPVLAAYISYAIADRPGLMVGFVGGALALSGATLTSPDGGVSAGFLGALIAGFAAGYLMLGLRRLCSHLPKTLDGMKPVLIYPVAGLALMGLFMCLINPGVGSLNTALYSGLAAMGGTSRIALGALLAGMMAIDMGGPFNKAAYVFATSTLAATAAAGGSEVMAAVMAGGMVPPLALALCCSFFKNRFTAIQRKSGLVGYILGLCFITEGAIPFAAADPLRVIPACAVGSALAGGLSMYFHCAIPAPHGGIFVFPLITNLAGFAVALVAGSLLGMLLLALLKQKKTEE